jgi:hypothetical protein
MTPALRRTVERRNKRVWWPLLSTEIRAQRAPFRLIVPLDEKRTAHLAKKLTFATPRAYNECDRAIPNSKAGVWRILCIAQIEHKRISADARSANPKHTRDKDILLLKLRLILDSRVLCDQVAQRCFYDTYVQEPNISLFQTTWLRDCRAPYNFSVAGF